MEMDAQKTVTTISLTEFKAEDIMKIKPQKAQSDFLSFIDEDMAIHLEKVGLSYTFIDSNDEIVSICGVLPVNKVGVTWAVHAESFKQHAREITRTVRNFFNNLETEGSFDELKGSVVDGFEGGHKWMKILGFTKGEHIEDRGYHEYRRKF